MDILVLEANINFYQKLILIVFLLFMSFYHLKSNSWRMQKLKGSETDGLMPEFYVQMKYIMSWLIIILFPMLLSFLNNNISFGLFIGYMVVIYTGLMLLFAVSWAFANSKKLWEKVEGWF